MKTTDIFKYFQYANQLAALAAKIGGEFHDPTMSKKAKVGNAFLDVIEALKPFIESNNPTYTEEIEKLSASLKETITKYIAS